MTHRLGPVEKIMIEELGEKYNLTNDNLIYYAIRKLYDDNFGNGSSTELLFKWLEETENKK